MPKSQSNQLADQELEVRWHPSNVAEIRYSATTTSPQFMPDATLRRLGQALSEVDRHDPAAEGLIIFVDSSQKPNSATQDAISQLSELARSTDATQRKHSQTGQRLFRQLAEMECPVVCAVNGPCTGNLFELALSCDFRVAAEPEESRWGFPEIELGLTPGSGGSVLLARLIPLTSAVSLLTSGQTLLPKQAQALGVVDQITTARDLLATSQLAVKSIRSDGTWQQTRQKRTTIVDDAEKQLAQLTPVAEAIVERRSVFPFAPTVMLEHVARTALHPLHAALESETEAFVQACGSPANLGLLNHQLLLLHNREKPGLVDLGLTTTPIRTIGIVGAGLMGSTIAANCFTAGKAAAGNSSRPLNREVFILDADPKVAATAEARILESHPKANVKATDSFQQIGQCDLVIESVVETLEIKKTVIDSIAEAAKPNTIVATNTSAIPVGQLAGFTKCPERFCGIHFCHPELMSLVEVICGPQTDEQTVACAVQWVRELGKMPVAVNDGAGFVVNRLLAAMVDQSLRILTNGVRIETIDMAMREFGFQGGPFEIMDVIGIDTCMYAGQTMWNAGLSCVSLSPILPRLVKRKRLGRKSSAGFYRYAEAGGPAVSDDDTLVPIIEAYLNEPLPENDEDTKQSQRIEIRNQILAAIAREAANIVDEEIVADIRDIDLCIIHGFGFPRHWGGILFWADQFGIANLVRVLDTIALKEPKLAPTKLLRSMAVNEKTFYG